MVAYEVLDGVQALQLVAEVGELYAEVFAEPPYLEGPQDVARFVEHFTGDLTRPGFGLVRAADGSVLVGVAYGWTMAAGAWFSRPEVEPPPEVRDVPRFAVMEWMVRSDRRGEGVGRRLMDLLLAGRPESWAVLAANPAALARRIYQRWGWRPLGPIRPAGMPALEVLALPLRRGH
jgi:GNAT superfamily N-acetyltransferase